jgi:hypothetical protein
MSRALAPSVHTAGGPPGIRVGIAGVAWLGAWLGGNLLGSLVISASGRTAGQSTTPIWVTVVGALGLWAPMILMLREVSRRFGTAEFAADYGVRFRLIDVLGLPIGVLSQLGLLRLVYWPLESVWDTTFSQERLERSARTLVDSAHGVWIAALVLIVVVGAPVVEELTYRGLLQGAFVRRVHPIAGVCVVAAWFAIIHFRPVEYPGLFVFGLVLGGCALATRRLGMSVCAHVAFNATGLVMVMRR